MKKSWIQSEEVEKYALQSETSETCQIPIRRNLERKRKKGNRTLGREMLEVEKTMKKSWIKSTHYKKLKKRKSV